MKNESLRTLFCRLWHHINSRRRRQFILLLILMVLTSLAEALSMGAILPYLGVLTAPEKLFENPEILPILNLVGIYEANQLLLPLTIAFCTATLLAGAMRLLLLWATTRLSFSVGADFSTDIYFRTLHQPYIVHCSRKSSELINGITGKANRVIDSAIYPALTLISACLMMLTLLIVLLMITPLVALVAFAGFGLIYVIIIYSTKSSLSRHSARIASESTHVIKSLQEGLGGIRDVLLDGSQEVYCQVYRSADQPLRRAQASNLFISSSPRFGMEALGILLITILAYALSQQPDGITKAIPILGALALGAQRLLPIMQQAYGSWSNIRGGEVSLRDTLELLEQPLPYYLGEENANSLIFENYFTLKKVGFRYNPQKPYVLKEVDLHIIKGSRVGFVGATGNGKSTMLDIIMGLLKPTHGVLSVDGIDLTFENNRSWQLKIAHVPQSIFLADTSIEENIAFGIPKFQIDHNRLRQAAKIAQIADTIHSWPDQYQTQVGERGILLSGGQRQRIGIARALYKRADIIIFDEATSALDNVTEEALMSAIEELDQNITLLIVAHRLTTLRKCSQIFEIADGKVKPLGDYENMMKVVRLKSHGGCLN